MIVHVVQGTNPWAWIMEYTVFRIGEVGTVGCALLLLSQYVISKDNIDFPKKKTRVSIQRRTKYKWTERLIQSSDGQYIRYQRLVSMEK
jgi:hypothetical protein